VLIEDRGRLTNDFLSRLVTFPHFPAPANKCSATDWSLAASYQKLDETDRSLVASKKPGNL
jgi:hypothetical protein